MRRILFLVLLIVLMSTYIFATNFEYKLNVLSDDLAVEDLVWDSHGKTCAVLNISKSSLNLLNIKEISFFPTNEVYKSNLEEHDNQKYWLSTEIKRVDLITNSNERVSLDIRSKLQSRKSYNMEIVPKVAKTILIVNINIPGATVTINNNVIEVVGNQIELDLFPGQYHLLVEKEDYSTVEKRIIVTENGAETNIELERNEGILIISTNPEKANVMLNGVSYNKNTDANLSEGKYNVVISLPNYETIYDSIVLDGGDYITKSYELTKKLRDVSFDVSPECSNCIFKNGKYKVYSWVGDKELEDLDYGEYHLTIDCTGYNKVDEIVYIDDMSPSSFVYNLTEKDKMLRFTWPNLPERYETKLTIKHDGKILHYGGKLEDFKCPEKGKYSICVSIVSKNDNADWQENYCVKVEGFEEHVDIRSDWNTNLHKRDRCLGSAKRISYIMSPHGGWSSMGNYAGLTILEGYSCNKHGFNVHLVGGMLEGTIYQALNDEYIIGINAAYLGFGFHYITQDYGFSNSLDFIANAGAIGSPSKLKFNIDMDGDDVILLKEEVNADSSVEYDNQVYQYVPFQVKYRMDTFLFSSSFYLLATANLTMTPYDFNWYSKKAYDNLTETNYNKLEIVSDNTYRMYYTLGLGFRF